jgi:murein DD-endopeptidase MepM/ murein hydrolase activator NlpD
MSTGQTSTAGLIIPVAGVKPDQLVDTFSASRSAPAPPSNSVPGSENAAPAEPRYHDAIDIMAPAGTPVVAAADGEIVRFWDSDRGGITIYQVTDDRKFVLYYAHLQRRADEIREGMHVKQGATIGFVGDTGNAGAGNYHLHFSIARITDPKRIWSGTYINPFPLLKNGSYPDVP